MQISWKKQPALAWSWIFIILLESFAVVTLCPAGERHAVLFDVNGRKITQTDINEMAKRVYPQLFPEKTRSRDTANITLAGLTPEEVEQLSDRAIHEMIQLELVADEAHQLGLRVNATDVEERLRRSGRNPLALLPLERRIAEKDLLIPDILRFRGYIPQRARPADIADFWEKSKDAIFRRPRKIKMRYMFVRINPLEPTLAKQQMNNAYNELSRTRPDQRATVFDRIAKDISEDLLFAKNGGLMMFQPDGWIEEGKITNHRRDNPNATLFPQPVWDTMMALQNKGEMTKLLVEDEMIHLALLEDVQPGDQLAYSEAQPIISNYLYQVSRANCIHSWMVDMLKRSRVLWHDGAPYEEVEAVLPKPLTADEVFKNRR